MDTDNSLVDWENESTKPYSIIINENKKIAQIKEINHYIHPNNIYLATELGLEKIKILGEAINSFIEFYQNQQWRRPKRLRKSTEQMYKYIEGFEYETTMNLFLKNTSSLFKQHLEEWERLIPIIKKHQAIGGLELYLSRAKMIVEEFPKNSLEKLTAFLFDKNPEREQRKTWENNEEYETFVNYAPAFMYFGGISFCRAAEKFINKNINHHRKNRIETIARTIEKIAQPHTLITMMNASAEKAFGDIYVEHANILLGTCTPKEAATIIKSIGEMEWGLRIPDIFIKAALLKKEHSLAYVIKELKTKRAEEIFLKEKALNNAYIRLYSDIYRGISNYSDVTIDEFDMFVNTLGTHAISVLNYWLKSGKKEIYGQIIKQPPSPEHTLITSQIINMLPTRYFSIGENYERFIKAYHQKVDNEVVDLEDKGFALQQLKNIAIKNPEVADALLPKCITISVQNPHELRIFAKDLSTLDSGLACTIAKHIIEVPYSSIRDKLPLTTPKKGRSYINSLSHIKDKDLADHVSMLYLDHNTPQQTTEGIYYINKQQWTVASKKKILTEYVVIARRSKIVQQRIEMWLHNQQEKPLNEDQFVTVIEDVRELTLKDWRAGGCFTRIGFNMMHENPKKYQSIIRDIKDTGAQALDVMINNYGGKRAWKYNTPSQLKAR